MEFSITSVAPPPPPKVMENIFFIYLYMGSRKCFNAKNFLFFVFFWTIGKIPCTLPLILGIPTPKCRGTYPGGGVTMV